MLSGLVINLDIRKVASNIPSPDKNTCVSCLSQQINFIQVGGGGGGGGGGELSINNVKDLDPSYKHLLG